MLKTGYFVYILDHLLLLSLVNREDELKLFPVRSKGPGLISICLKKLSPSLFLFWLMQTDLSFLVTLFLL